MALNRVAVVVTFLVNVLQIMYGSKHVSPLDTHPNIMLISISTFLLYCSACYLEHHTSMFRSWTWPASALALYTNFKRFLGFISIVSLASIIFSTSSTTLAIVYLLSFLFFSGTSVLSLMQNTNLFGMRRSNNYSNMQDNRLTDPLSMAEKGMINIKNMKRELAWQARRVCQLENELQRKHKEYCMSLRGEAVAELGGEVNANQGLPRVLPPKGIVIDGIENTGVPDSVIVKTLDFAQDNQLASTKGKSKMVGETLLFNNNGLWSQEAIATLEKGKYMNKKLCKMVLHLEDKVIGNVSLADWLEIKLKEKRSPSWKEQAGVK